MPAPSPLTLIYILIMLVAFTAMFLYTDLGGLVGLVVLGAYGIAVSLRKKFPDTARPVDADG